MAISTPITILGGGPAGLAVAYYARQRGVPFVLFEAGGQLGGNCMTFRHGDFLYDAGAHRFHDVNPAVTREVRRLLGDDLQPVQAPSQIYLSGRMIDFPLAPLDLLKKLGLGTLLRGTRDFLQARARPSAGPGSFEEVVCSRYGRTVAELFLLKYSEKLWGVPPRLLASTVAGRRLQGLDLATFVVEMARGAKGRTRHLDGTFFYPRLGYGMITQKLAEAAGKAHIRTSTRVSKIRHAGQRIIELAINDSTRVAVEEVVSTLPVNRLLELLEPCPPPAVQELSRQLKFRQLILVALFLDCPSVTANASVYFPENHIPFTRVSEPRNRSPRLSPPGQTSLVVELPCGAEDERWRSTDTQLCQSVQTTLSDLGWLKPGMVIGSEVRRIGCAYPVLEIGFENVVQGLADYLAGFQNLTLTGRNALFTYTHLHDQMQRGCELIDQYASRHAAES